MEGKQPKFIISGGGTGGHIFPALSIAKELKRQYPEGEFLFIGAEGRMEMECVPKEGFSILGLPVKGIDRKHIWKNAIVFYKFIKSLWIVRKVLRNFKPNVVIGVGGYASGPTLYLAQKMGIPTLIQEQNSYAGVANKWLSKRAKVVCVAYPKMERFFPKEKIVITGNPVRKDFTELDRVDKKEALQYFGLKEDLPTLFLVGGSLGAGTMNRSVMHSIQSLKERRVQLLWQCGKYYYENMKKFLEENPCENIHLLPFISRMDYAYALSDIILTRAGAGALSELSLVGKPIIMIPSPNVAEDHQTKNALSIVEQGGGIMVKDRDAEENLFPTALKLLSDSEKMHFLGENIKKIALPNATYEIVECIKGLL